MRGSVYKIVEQGFRKEKSEAAKTIAPPLRIRPSREELDESEGERDDAPAENPRPGLLILLPSTPAIAPVAASLRLAQ